MAFSFGQSGTKQIKKIDFQWFITKTKQMTFNFGLAGIKQNNDKLHFCIYYLRKTNEVRYTLVIRDMLETCYRLSRDLLDTC